MSAQDFKIQLLRIFYQDVHQFQQDNYDTRRFSHDGVDRSQVFDAGAHAQNLDWFTSNYDSVYRTYLRLADQQSRDLYVDLLRFKLSGHLHVRIKTRIPVLAAEAERFKKTFTGVPSTLPVSGMFGTLIHYDEEWNGARYTVDTLKDGLLVNLVYGQYFFNRNGVSVRPQPGDYVVDGGACTGDTMAVFRAAIGPAGHVYAFDPVQIHVDICRFNASRPGFENTTVFPYGISDRNFDAPMVQSDGYQPGYHPSSEEATVPLRRIDDLVMSGEIKRIDFIKMDVEGSELSALRGAVSSIHRFKPKLAISIYHRPDDFFQICDFIDDLRIGYRFYLDHYTIHAEETVLYAIAV